MNRELIDAASLQTFNAPHGLPPAAYVQQEMTPRGGGYDPAFLRENHARVIAAENVNGLALVTLLRLLDKEDPEQTGFATVAYDLTGAQIYRSATAEGSKLPKSMKTGYREFGEVIEHLSADTGLVVHAIERERDAALNRAEHLASLLSEFGDTAQNDADAPPVAAEGGSAVASMATRQRRPSRQQGARRE